jgi:hypothetical protein
MLGSLQNPPIIVGSSRRKWFLILCGAVIFVWAALHNFNNPNAGLKATIFGYLSIFLFGAGIPIAVYKLIRPSTLEISPEGIKFKNLFQTRHYRWRDVANFRAYKPTRKSLSNHVGLDYASDYNPATHAARSAAKRLTGVEGSLGGDWEIGASELANLLNAARTQWFTIKPAKGRQPALLYVYGPIIGFLNLLSGRGTSFLEIDRAVLAPLFQSSVVSSKDYPRCHVLFLYCDIDGAGRIVGTKDSLRELARACGARVVVLATQNDVNLVAKSMGSQNDWAANYVLTANRNGEKFAPFFLKLFGAMFRGTPFAHAWVQLAPQNPNAPPDHDVPGTLTILGIPQLVFQKM